MASPKLSYYRTLPQASPLGPALPQQGVTIFIIMSLSIITHTELAAQAIPKKTTPKLPIAPRAAYVCVYIYIYTYVSCRYVYYLYIYYINNKNDNDNNNDNDNKHNQHIIIKTNNNNHDNNS